MTSARLTLYPLESAQQTAAEMLRLVQSYAADIGDKANWPLIRFFDFVKKLPYRADPPGNETISRPALSMRKEWPARDCDDKAILLASWCHMNKTPWCFVASSTRTDGTLHHVFLNAVINGKKTVLDATYPKNQFGETPNKERITKQIFLTGWQGMNTLSVFEGEELGFSLKSIKKGVSKVAKVAKKPVASSIRATKKFGTAVKSGSVTKIARATKNVALAPARDIKRTGISAAKVVSRNMPIPTAIKNGIKSAVRRVAGDKVTTATKAILLPSATAAALAVPGAQPFALAVPVVVNMALDEIIAAGKKKVSSVVKKTVSQPAKKKAVQNVRAAVAQAPKAPPAPNDAARARAAALKTKMQEAKETAVESAPVAVETDAESSGLKKYAKPAAIAGAAVVALMILKGRKK